MRDGFDKRVLRAGLRLAGVLAAGTGLSVAARGTKAIPGGGPVPPSVDNVLRFYAVWWAGSGVLMWQAAGDPERYDRILKGILAVNFLGGLVRLHSARQSGQPHPLFQAIAIEELVVSPAMLLLQRRVAEGRGPLRDQA
jgi:hypothetical protein